LIVFSAITFSIFLVLLSIAMTSHVVWLVSRGCQRRYSFTSTFTTS
jgi:hypothetical protein